VKEFLKSINICWRRYGQERWCLGAIKGISSKLSIQGKNNEDRLALVVLVLQSLFTCCCLGNQSQIIFSAIRFFWQWTATLWRHVGGSSSSVRLRHKRSAFNRWRLGDIGLGPYILRLQHYIVVIVPSKRQLLRQHVQEKIVARLQFCDIFALVIYFVIFILFLVPKIKL